MKIKTNFTLKVLVFLLFISCSSEPVSSDKEENKPPLASFTANPDSGDTFTIIEFDASLSTDTEDPTSSLSLRWSFNNDGKWDTEYSTTKKAYYQFATKGIKKVMLEVRDSGGLLDSAINFVYISTSNTPPVAAFNIEPKSGDVSDNFLFDASESYDNEDPSHVLQVRWDWQNDGTWDTDFSTIRGMNHQFTTEGFKRITMEVRDSGGLNDTITNKIYVDPANLAPVALFTITPDSGTTTDIFSFDASLSYDSEDASATIQVRWDWEKDGLWDTEFSKTKVIEHLFSQAGIYNVVLEVKDSKGLTDTTVSTVKVTTGNQPPVAIFFINPPDPTIFNEVELNASGSYDPEGSDIQLRWDWENDGIWDSDYTNEKLIYHQFEIRGVYTVKLEVIDSENQIDTTTRQINVTGESGTMMDIDDNVYQTVKIGNQWWMAENLKVKRFRNGDSIPSILSPGAQTDGKYYEPLNDPTYFDTYGLLYDWYAVNNSKDIAPDGWHIPTDEEWKEMEMNLGMSEQDANDMGGRGTNEGAQLKEAGFSHWVESYSSGSNTSGFTAVPGGYYYSSFWFKGETALFWTATETNSEAAIYRQLLYNDSGIFRNSDPKNYGYSIRCVKD